jgi:hypothetical protein
MDSPGCGKATWGFIAAAHHGALADGAWDEGWATSQPVWIGGSSLVKIWRSGMLGFGGELRRTELRMDLDCVGAVGRRTRGIGAWVSRESCMWVSRETLVWFGAPKTRFARGRWMGGDEFGSRRNKSPTNILLHKIAK